MRRVLEEGVTCSRVVRTDESAVLIDARAYYATFYRAALRAKRYVLLAGWQFDTEAVLLRGDDARDAPAPVELLPFLAALSKREPELRIYLLAWDYSLAYALEREWLQELRFLLGAPASVRFEFDRHPHLTGSHHQKFVVIDGALAFAGGLDLCDERWDDRSHAANNPLRVNAAGEPCRPNHEVQAAVTGDAAAFLAEVFRARWLDACGEELSLAPPDSERRERLSLRELSAGFGLPLSVREVGVSRTAVLADGSVQKEILSAHARAFAAAERLIYIETQYFTSRNAAAALLARLHDTSLPKLAVVIVLPLGADNGKEKFALGEMQSMVLGTLERAARDSGHELRFLCSTVDGDASGSTFIHSKVLVVDDRLLSVGSANMTERSMGFDSEIALIWEAAPGSPLEADIRRVRSSLLAEHAGGDEGSFRSIDGLIGVIDRAIASPGSRLGACHFEPCAPNALKSVIFDPGGPVELPDWVEPATAADRERFTRGGGRTLRELSRRSLSQS